MATTLIFFIVSIFFPIYSSLKVDRQVLEDRRVITRFLHDDLQLIVQNRNLRPNNYKENINGKSVQIFIKDKAEMIEACGVWKNDKKKEEQICLYGIEV